MRSVYVPLPDDVRIALTQLAARELRRPQDQAAVLLIRALNERIPPQNEAPSIIAAADALADAVELWRGEQRKSVQDALNAYYAARRHPGESAQAGAA